MGQDCGRVSVNWGFAIRERGWCRAGEAGEERRQGQILQEL